jgi:hypothetical protein
VGDEEHDEDLPESHIVQSLSQVPGATTITDIACECITARKKYQ